MPDRDAEVTVIGPGARLEGLLVSGGTLRIEGEVKGEVRAEGGVLIAPSAKVEAEVRAQSLRVEGRYVGNAEVSSLAELGATAQVQGNLTCGALVVAEGAVFNGQTAMSAGAPVIALPEMGSAEQG
ncbi:MAG: polymer-forming cytoskeletal protein [Acidobacteria bacterium]|nr:polymer-forming cytoskeletal protein [Acidobacteriota bacterium]